MKRSFKRNRWSGVGGAIVEAVFRSSSQTTVLYVVHAPTPTVACVCVCSVVTHLKECDPFGHIDPDRLHRHRFHVSFLDVERVEGGSDIGFERSDYVAVDPDLKKGTSLR